VPIGRAGLGHHRVISEYSCATTQDCQPVSHMGRNGLTSVAGASGPDRTSLPFALPLPLPLALERDTNQTEFVTIHIAQDEGHRIIG
jgi:hypothetical protein